MVLEATQLQDAQQQQLLTPPPRAALPALHYAIARADQLRLPAFALGYDSSGHESAELATSDDDDDDDDDDRALRLAVAHCETPHFAAGVVPFCPEASPTVKTPATSSLMMAASLESYCSAAAEELKRAQQQQQKKGTRRGTLNPEAKSVLKAWMFSPEHFAHPYPSEEEKEELATEAGIEVKQLSNWFTNARKRLWQPVLRQSGVEVKNFLSTGRGGPRGSKLDVPPNLQSLVPSSPPPSPRQRSSSAGAFSDTSASSTSSSPLKRTWSEMEASLPGGASPPDGECSGARVAPSSAKAAKRKKTSAATASARKKSTGRKATAPGPAMTKVANQLSQELRLALAERAAANLQAAPHKAATFQELEILAATSLIGLHQQQYQPVH